MSEYQFDQSAVIIENSNNETIEEQAHTLEKELEEKINNNELSMWDMDSNNFVGDNFDHIFLTAGLGNQKIIFDNTVSYLVFGDNVKDTAADKPIEAYRNKPTPEQNVTILAGRKAGINYTANGESGTLINTTGNLIFHADMSTFIEINGKRKNLNPSQIQKGNWNITSSDGNNQIYLGIGNQTIRVGDGNNIINANKFNLDTDITQLNQNVTAGNGNNIISIVGNATVTVGKGDNTINTSYYYTDDKNNYTNDNTNYTKITQKITTGNGNNNIYAAGNVNITTGSGNDFIYTNYYYNSDQLDLTQLNQNIDAGNGTNNISVIGNVTVVSGSGNDTIYARSYNHKTDITQLNQYINAGDGNNNITTTGNSTIISGKGNDYFDVNTSVDSTLTNLTKLHNQINTGNGDKTLSFQGNMDFTAGNGTHTIYQEQHLNDPKQYLLAQNHINLGDGEINISLSNGMSTITAGNGGGTVVNEIGYMNLTVGEGDYGIYSIDEENQGHNIIHTGNGNNNILMGNMSYSFAYNDITTGDGNDMIDLGGNHNTIHGGLGHNSISLSGIANEAYTNLGHNYVYTKFGSFNTIDAMGGNNHIYSMGQDTINADYQSSVTLLGGNSEVNATNAIITDLSNHNRIITNFSSTITGSSDSTIQFSNTNNNDLPFPDPGHDNLFIEGYNDTISATDGSNLKAIRGENNQFNVDGNFVFIDGTGNNSATVNGGSTIQGNNSLNLTLKATGQNNNIFQAGNGNETLNGTQSQAALRVYANQNSKYTNFVASTGTGDDLLYAGQGNSTFSGGLGNNIFIFDKNDDNYGQTVIKDFSVSKGNKIGLFDYGLNQNSLNTLLQTAKNDSQGNAILKLNNHNITIQGLQASDLHADQFLLAPTNKIA